MNVWFLAGGFLVVAQLVGVYALVTRKADFIFSLVMAVLLLVAVLIVGFHLYHRVH